MNKDNQSKQQLTARQFWQRTAELGAATKASDVIKREERQQEDKRESRKLNVG